MSDHQKLKEILSALFDDEAGKTDQLELRRLARSLEDHPDLVATYQRYALARAALNGASLHSSANYLLANVSSALEKEEMEAAPPASAVSHPVAKPDFNWLRAAGRVAIAASVAVIAVYAVQLQTPITDRILQPQIAATRSVTPSGTQTDQGNRVLNSRVMTVSAGDSQPFPQASEERATLPAGCIMSALRADSSSLVWETELPAGYVLCKQNEQTKQCESVASKIGCYLN